MSRELLLLVDALARSVQAIHGQSCVLTISLRELDQLADELVELRNSFGHALDMVRVLEGNGRQEAGDRRQQESKGIHDLLHQGNRGHPERVLPIR